MISNFPSLFIALRYLKPSKKNTMVSIISLFSFLGILLFFIFAKINYKVYFTYSKLIYIISVLSLILVLFLSFPCIVVT